MFTITTARPGETYHALHPHERLGYAVAGLGFDYELEMGVCHGFGPGDDGARWIVKFWLNDSAAGTRVEVIDRKELLRRCAVARDNGDEYDQASIHVTRDNDGLQRYTEKLKAHFLALMALKLFYLPIA